MKKVRILLVDDHPMIRHGIKALLNDVEQFEVIDEAGDGQEAIDKVATLDVDLVVMDIKMPNKTGIEATAEITSRFKEVKVLALSMYDEQRYIVKILQAGALGYILKNTGKQELMKAIRTVMSGESYFSQEVSSIMMSQFMSGRPTKSADLLRPDVSLTKRETEIIKLIAEEMTNSEIAGRLGISPRTVDTHRRNLLQKLDVKNTAGLVKYALHNNLLE